MNDIKIASLCLLAYKRQEMLQKCLESLHMTLDIPSEVIINYDGIEGSKFDFNLDQASKFIINHGNNRGVGRSFQNCLGVAEGDYIFKVDTDLIFHKNWLSTAISILEKNLDIGAISLFDYRHYDPKDTRFNILEEREDCYIVDDFVSSIYGFRKAQLGIVKGHRGIIADDGIHHSLKTGRYSLETGEYISPKYLAITKTDFVTNQGFGLGKSVYVVPDKDGNPVAAKTYSSPFIFNKPQLA
ncbi:MAG: glycosyltransferase [Sulfurovaceae bacterium]|nr:glycosyltransferase [Sulfurovaceae bacterium]